MTGGAGRPAERLMLDRVALVTGASSGIGRAVSISLAESGATVLLVGRNLGRLRATEADILGRGGSAVTTPCDLRDDAAIHDLAGRVRELGRGLHVLVHAAGTIDFGDVEATDVASLDDVMRVNLHAPFLVTKVLLDPLRESHGHIVFVNSSAGIRPSAGVAAYGASKHALRGLADALRDEVNRQGIRVTSIYPGRTATPMQASVFDWEGRGTAGGGELLDAADIGALVLAVVALPAGAEVTDVHVRPARPLKA